LAVAEFARIQISGRLSEFWRVQLRRIWPGLFASGGPARLAAARLLREDQLPISRQTQPVSLVAMHDLDVAIALQKVFQPNRVWSFARNGCFRLRWLILRICHDSLRDGDACQKRMASRNARGNALRNIEIQYHYCRDIFQARSGRMQTLRGANYHDVSQKKSTNVDILADPIHNANPH
jgi:hypothetical protein